MYIYRHITKRVFDVSLGFLSLLLVLPLLFVISLSVLVSMGRPVFFMQKRVGYQGRHFVLCKFRTMRDVYDAEGNLTPDKDRTTRLGSFLRSSSIDELPSLLNVLTGQMSIVGPRPLLCEYMPLYSVEQARRHDVRPGITGWAQINGRNAISWTKKLELDVWYVDNISFLLDMKIMFYTLLKVLKREGIDQNKSVTMEKFTGAN